MTLIDTHTHIYLDEFENPTDILERAKQVGVERMLLPAIDSNTHKNVIDMCNNNPLCLPMMGLHPCSVKENYQTELDIAEKYLKENKCVAVGETGLDFYWDTSFVKEQYDSFNKQIEWSKEYRLPVVIHSRNSTDECIDVIKRQQDGNLRGVFHCFSGTLEQARQIIDLGFYLGIGGVVTFKNSGLAEVLKELSLERIVLETDAPYLAPVPFRGKRNEPAYLVPIAEKIAAVKGMELNDVAAITTLNTKKLFSL